MARFNSMRVCIVDQVLVIRSVEAYIPLCGGFGLLSFGNTCVYFMPVWEY